MLFYKNVDNVFSVLHQYSPFFFFFFFNAS